MIGSALGLFAKEAAPTLLEISSAAGADNVLPEPASLLLLGVGLLSARAYHCLKRPSA